MLKTYHDQQERSKGEYQYVWVLSGGNDEPYRIEVTVIGTDCSWKMREVVANQHCGFLITSDRIYNRQGDLSYEATVEPHQVTPLIWVPGKVREWSEENRTVVMTLMNIKINSIIPDEQFSLESMALNPEDTILVERFPNSKPVAKAFYGGEWIPENLWPEEVQKRIQNMPRHLPANSASYDGIWIKGSATD